MTIQWHGKWYGDELGMGFTGAIYNPADPIQLDVLINLEVYRRTAQLWEWEAMLTRKPGRYRSSVAYLSADDARRACEDYFDGVDLTTVGGELRRPDSDTDGGE